MLLCSCVHCARLRSSVSFCIRPHSERPHLEFQICVSFNVSLQAVLCSSCAQAKSATTINNVGRLCQSRPRGQSFHLGRSAASKSFMLGRPAILKTFEILGICYHVMIWRAPVNVAEYFAPAQEMLKNFGKALEFRKIGEHQPYTTRQ